MDKSGLRYIISNNDGASLTASRRYKDNVISFAERLYITIIK